MIRKWIRTCQECLHKQTAKPPNQAKELSDSYRNSICRKCKSEALDYGSYIDIPENDAEKEQVRQWRED